MSSDRPTLRVPQGTMALFSGVPGAWDSQSPALFLADSPMIVCNFKRSEFYEDFLLRMILEHERIHRHFMFEFLPFMSYFWIEVHALEEFQRILEGKSGKPVLEVDTSESKDIAPVGLLDLGKYFPTLSEKYFTFLRHLCEGFALVRQVFHDDFSGVEKAAFFEELLEQGPKPELAVLTELLELHKLKGLQPYDVLTALNIAVLRSPHVDRDLDDFLYILHSDMLLDSSRDLQLQALGSLIAKGCWVYDKLSQDMDIKLVAPYFDHADEILYVITDAMYKKSIRYFRNEVPTSPPLPSMIVNLVTAIFASFYRYARNYLQREDRFENLMKKLWSAGGCVTNVWFTDALVIMGMPQGAGELLENAPKLIGDDGYVTDLGLIPMAGVSWSDYLFTRRIRSWCAGKEKKLVCPVYDFFRDSLKENADRLHEFCATDSQSETFCCVATDEFDLEKVQKMNCPFGRELSDLFKDFEKVKIIRG
ncbi:hypothetical protein MYX82_04485 [Acidobacteria bacterium AH-259-D05]|nr:hypothetical protein [Acidobacteria bacterium AH-259-D05]